MYPPIMYCFRERTGVDYQICWDSNIQPIYDVDARYHKLNYFRINFPIVTKIVLVFNLKQWVNPITGIQLFPPITCNANVVT